MVKEIRNRSKESIPMKVIGLDSKTYSWYLVGYVPLGDDQVERSSFHLLARKLLTSLFPLDRILEEIPLPGTGGLTADFYVPTKRLLVEVHGEQHYKYIPHFHGSPYGFILAKRRDENKKLWAQLNKITLVELPYLENIDEWRNRVRKATVGENRQSVS